MATVAVPLSVDVSVAIQHKANSAQQFTGDLPTSQAVWTTPTVKFPADNGHGGLFWFQQAENVCITDFAFDFGANVTTWKLFIVTVNSLGVEQAGENIQVAGGATVAFVSKTQTRITLGMNQALKLVTTGATGAMIARVWGVLERGYMGG